MIKKRDREKAKFYKKGLRSNAPPTKVIPDKRDKLHKKEAGKEIKENKPQGRDYQMDRIRIAVYIDGFNLYFGLRDKGWKKFYWLNLQLLAQNLLKPYQDLIGIKYFTSTILSNKEKIRRQKIYLEALKTLPKLEIHFGRYRLFPRTCNKCQFTDRVPSEKRTDVNIATHMIVDAFQDRYDTALLISGDSDLVPVVEAVKKTHPDKKIVLAFPPKRESLALSNLADHSFVIGRGKLAKSIFEDEIEKPDGFILRRPDSWR